MISLLLKLALGGLNVLKLLWSMIQRFFASLDAQGWIGLCVSLALAWFALSQHGDARHWKKQSDRYQALYAAEKTALEQTTANYRAAALKAQQEDAANKARVEGEQAKINQEASHDYEARIADARAAADRLRRQLAAAHPGSRPSAPVPGISTPAGGTTQSAANGFSVDDQLQCTEQSIQLDALIKWAKKQHEVNPNGRLPHG